MIEESRRPKYNYPPAYPVPTGGVPKHISAPIQETGIKIADPMPTRKHSHYFKDVSNLQTIDVYRVLQLFNVTDQALGHAIKKLLVAGGRGAGKDINRDVQEAIDTLERWKDIQSGI